MRSASRRTLKRDEKRSLGLKTALITGASSGLGKALALLLCSKNISLLLTGRDEEELTHLAAQLSVSTVRHCGDLREKSVRKELAHLIQTHDPDLIINNAGFGLYGNVLSHSIEEQLDLLKVNGEALLEITLVAAQHFKERKKRGIILNVSSATAFFPFPTFSVYAASKAFVASFSLALDDELKSLGIRVLTACPGQIATEFRKRAAKGFPQRRNFYTLAPEKAALFLWKQIERKKRLFIFDWKVRWMIRIAHLLPTCLIMKLLKKSISRRYTQAKHLRDWF